MVRRVSSLDLDVLDLSVILTTVPCAEPVRSAAFWSPITRKTTASAIAMRPTARKMIPTTVPVRSEDFAGRFALSIMLGSVARLMRRRGVAYFRASALPSR